MVHSRDDHNEMIKYAVKKMAELDIENEDIENQSPFDCEIKDLRKYPSDIRYVASLGQVKDRCLTMK